MTNDTNEKGRPAGQGRAASESDAGAYTTAVDYTAVAVQAAVGPVLLNMANVAAEAVHWLWPRHIAIGCLTLIVGAPGNGKSYATIDLTARITTGMPWPDGAPCPAGGVVLVSPEDDPGQVIRPRLDAAGADVSRVTLIDGVRVAGDNGRTVERGYSLDDLPATEQAIDATPGCRLLVIDPVGSVMGGDVDGHRDNEVRSVLAPLAKLAREKGIAVVLVLHTRKSGGGTADDRALGSRGFVGIARAVHHVIPQSNDADTLRYFLPGKINVGKKPPGLAFRITGEPAAVAWEPEPVTLTADAAYRLADGFGDDASDANDDDADAVASALFDAECVLGRLLIDGPRPCGDRTKPGAGTIRAEARDAGVSERTLQRAKAAINAGAYREHGVWHWRLPRDGGNVNLLPDAVRQALADDLPANLNDQTVAHLAHLNSDAEIGEATLQVRHVRHGSHATATAGALAAPTPRTPAADWLAATLLPGPMAVTDVRRLAKDAGLTHTKLSRAADLLAIIIEPADGEQSARWRLPAAPPLDVSPAIGADVKAAADAA
jgi:hypothetical protein